ncbi:MAG: hypothetical protein ACMXYK_04590, partial [Candidatus Woesearchaeota archaeon]
NQGSPRYQLARPVTRDEIDQNSIVTDSSRAHNPLRIGFGGNAPSIFGSDPNNHYVTAQDGCTYMLPNVNPYSSSAAQLRPVSVGHDPLGINRTIHTVSLSPVTSHNAAQIDADLGVSGSQGYFVDRAGHLYRQIDADTIIRAPKFVITQQSGGDVSQFNARLHQGNERPDNCYVNEVIREHTVQDYLTDPTQGFINSVRCGCLPAIEGYLVSTKNILTAIKNCFESVLVTNEFDSGVCRAILTQYLCDFVFDLLGCFVRSFSMESGENRDRNPISNFFTDLSSGGDHIRERSQRRYGQSATFNALFGNRQLIHQVCLAAFGYDWKPDLEAALSMGGEGIEIDTVGIVAPATRQFMSYNPNDEGRATHVYHVGYFLSAGGDIRWTLDLVCSTTNECSPDEGFEGGWCDCARGSATSNPGETPTQGNTMNEPGIGIIRRIDGGQLRAGDTLGTGGGDPYAPSQGDLYVSLDDSVRYDKVRLSWTSNQPDGKSGEILVPIRQTGGRAPAQCTFSLSLLQYRCGFTSIEDGFVYIQGVSEYRRGRASSADVGTEAFMQNEPIKFSVNYGYQRPASDREEIPRFIRTRITDSNGNLVDESFTDYNQLRPGSGTVVVPFNDISATRIAGGSRAILRSSASAQRVQGSTVPQLSLSYNSFTFEGSEVSYLVFEHNPSSNTLQYLEIPRSALQRNGGALTIGQYMEQNSNLPKVTLTALDDSAGAFTLKTAEGDRTITASCPGTDPCKSYITLSPDQNAPQSITEVCQGRNGEPLRWGVEIQVMNGRFDDNNQATVRGATPTPSISTVRPTSFSSDILIHCPTQFEGTEGSSNSCPYDVLLSTRDAGCMCQSTEVTEAMLTAENAQVYCVPPDSYAGETTSQTTFSIANNPRVCPLVGDDTVFRTPGGSVARCAYDILVRETRVNGDVRSTDMLERVESRSDTEIASSQNALRSGLSSDQTVARRTGTCGSGQFYDLFVDECRTG